MPPAKPKATHEDTKSDTASLKERNGHGSKDGHKTNGKLQRVASSTGSQLKEAASATKGSTSIPAATVLQPVAPGVSQHDDNVSTIACNKRSW
ncbi:hypothetical protein RRF57_000526 [Xylaria bambusicola]|uniref:Uncharacterized protein n=1 Tax=Xylaria bambusicola TaxID=326684 RepID=A0AAN7U3P9_9PEZI